MIKRIFYFVLLILIFGSLKFEANELEINGYVESDNRLRLDKDHVFSLNENTLFLKIKKDIVSRAAIHGNIELINTNKQKITDASDLQSTDKVDPCRLELKEAYINFHGFLTNNMDLTAGKQRIAWGTADKLNPTDNLNPDDLSDPMDFGKKHGINAFRADYYLGEYTLTGVYIPVFKPAVLSPSEWTPAQTFPLPQGINLGEYTSKVLLPESNLGNSEYAFKTASRFFNYDFSISYFNGRNDLPVTTRTTLASVDSTTTDINLEMAYPRTKIIGFDMAGSVAELWNIGIWIEGAYNMPEETNQVTQTASGITSEKIMNADFLKYVIGGDYTFKNGIYINTQFIHGFDNEIEKDKLKDYVFGAIRKNFKNDTFKLELRGGRSVSESGNLINPHLEYYPIDATEIILGCYFIDGKEGTNLGSLKNFDELYLKFKASF